MSIHTTKETRSGYATYGFKDVEKAGLDVDANNFPLWVDTNGVEEPIQLNLDAGRYSFVRTVTLTSAAAAAGISIITDAEVSAGRKVYITQFYANVAGATNWATTATVKVQDTNGTPVDFATFAVAGMTGNSKLYMNTANVTDEVARIRMTGGTAAKGLRAIGDANGTGSDFIVTVVGFIA